MGMRPQGNEQEARRNKHVRSAPSKIAVKALGEEVLDGILDKSSNPLLLILDCVQDPHNLGAILRTADGAGAGCRHRPPGQIRGHYGDGAARFRRRCGKVPFIQVTNLARTMKQLQSRGIWIFGTSDKGDRGLYETDFTGPAALVMGAEGEGMRRLTEENCDFLLRIPMKGSIPCLNVSVATGVCLYEIVRQRS